jgi:hypothetical protein
MRHFSKIAFKGMVFLLSLVVLSVSLVSMAAPPAPPIPAGYQPGTIANGDFTSGIPPWNIEVYGGNSQVVSESLGGDISAHLQSWGWWEEDWNFPDPTMTNWIYWEGAAAISQRVYVPLDATEVSFTYCNLNTPDEYFPDQMFRTPTLTVRMGENEQQLSGVADWTRVSIPVATGDRGRFVELAFIGRDGGDGVPNYDPYGGSQQPSEVATGSAYLDYLSIDGTTPTIHNTSWTPQGSTDWDGTANWSGGVVPNNTLTDAYNVTIPVSSPQAAMLTSERSVFSLTNQNYSAGLTVDTGGHLSTAGDCTVEYGRTEVINGGKMTVGADVVADWSLLHIADGGTENVLYVHGKMKVNDGSLVVVERAKGSVESVQIESGGAVQVTGAGTVFEARGLMEPNLDGSSTTHNVSIVSGGTLTVSDNAVLRSRYVFNRGAVTLEDGALDWQSSMDLRNYGTLSANGNNTIDGSVNNYGTFTVGSGETEISSYMQNGFGGVVSIQGGTLRALGLSLSSWLDTWQMMGTPMLSGLPGSTLAISSLDLNVHDPRSVALEDTRVEFGSGWMYTKGLDRGATGAGLLCNYAFEELVVKAGETMHLSGMGALYVKQLVIEEGATLYLDNAKVYYTEGFSNAGSVTGGSAQQAQALDASRPALRLISYDSSASAGGYGQFVEDGPAYSSFDDGDPFMMMQHSSSASSDSFEVDGAAFIKLHLEGRSDLGYEPPGSSASGHAIFVIDPTAEAPLGSMAQVSIYVGNPESGDSEWNCYVVHNAQTLVTFGTDEGETAAGQWMVFDVSVGDELEFFADLFSPVIPDGNFDYYHDLEVMAVIGDVFAQTFLLGDANGDGVVSAGDYASVQANFGNVGEIGILGDANLDGRVSAGDYASVQTNFGNVASAAKVAPEPATISLLLLSGAALIRRKRK